MVKKPKHIHAADCNHGVPTALPKHGGCGVCGVPFANRKPLAYCRVHFRWECETHVRIGVHHDPEKHQEARKEQNSLGWSSTQHARLET